MEKLRSPVQLQVVLCLQRHLHQLVPIMGIPIIVPIVQLIGTMPSNYVKMQVDILPLLLRKAKILLSRIIWVYLKMYGLGLPMRQMKEHTRG